MFLHIVWNSSCSLYVSNTQAMKANFVLQLHIILITVFSSSFSDVFLVWFWMYTNSCKCYKCLLAFYFVFFHMQIAFSTLCSFHILYFLFFDYIFHCFLEPMWDQGIFFNVCWLHKSHLGCNVENSRGLGFNPPLRPSIFVHIKLNHKFLLLWHSKMHLYINRFCHHML